ncbi:MAG: hypothetical protein ACD_40C00019G0001 [uncultured bacterium]|nr:MAG: hypothetical protein ACD_40C00019G0001 [uncultured bacterium]
MAVGVARPRAQGQAMTRIPTKLMSPRSGLPRIVQVINTIMASTKTMGTKTAEILSVKRSIGAWLPWADSTILMIWERTVPSPMAVALN